MIKQESADRAPWYCVWRWQPRILFVLLIAAVVAPSGPSIGGSALELAITVGAFSLIVVAGEVIWRGSSSQTRRMGRVEIGLSWLFVGVWALCVVGLWIGAGPLVIPQ